ncbi:hypothetical protein HY418_03630 [Candidatus Kaiserbacteria bacterium]|nr:hypothetical protein [Candidatus Kaiserbacteria bacterium]
MIFGTGIDGTGTTVSTGKIGIGTTTPNWTLTSSNSTGPQLSLGDGTNNSWTLRNSGATLYLATSTYSATSTVAALTFNNSTGAATFGSPATSTFSGGLTSPYLNITGTAATSTFARGVDLAGGCFSVNGTCLVGNGQLLASANIWSALQTFQSGLLSQASSTFTGFTRLANASTTQLTNSGTTWLPSLASAVLGVDTSGKVVATSSIGANLLSGTITNAQLANSSVTINSAGLLTGGGSVSLGGSLNLNASTSPTVGYLFATSTRASEIPFASSTALTISGTGFFGTATSTSFYGANLKECTSNNVLTWSAGSFGCEADDTGAGGAWPFTPTTYNSIAVQSTSTGLWLTATSPFSLIASSTFATQASTTLFTNTGNTYLTALTSALLGTDSSGKVVATTSIGANLIGGTLTDSQISSASVWHAKLSSSSLQTSALLAGLLSDETGTGSVVFSASPTLTGTANLSSLIALASSTIGAGTQAGGLTISGGATTTGNLIVQGGATSTFSNGISSTYLALTGTAATSTAANGWNLASGCFSVSGTCLVGNAQLLASANIWSALQTFQSGLLSQASSTFTGFTQLANASTTQFTSTGTTWLTSLASTVLGVDTTGKVVATSSIGANLLSGTITNAQLANSSVTINSAGLLSGGGSVSLGGTLSLNASTSPTVGYLFATSTRASEIPFASSTALTVSGNAYLTSLASTVLGVDTSGKVVATTTIGANLIGGTLADSQISSASVWNAKLSSSSLQTSALLAGLLSDETGTGNVVFSASPTLTGTANLSSLIALASSTIGAGGQATGLTISGGATTTATSTLAGLIVNSGNVGLGTSTPKEKLHIDGKLRFANSSETTDSGNAKIFTDTVPEAGADGGLIQSLISGYGFDGSGIIMQFGGTADGGGIKLTDDGLIVWGAGDEDLFRLIDEDANLTRFVVADTGEVGIGTTTPNWKLTSSNSTGPQLSLGDGTNNSWTLRNAVGTLYLATSTYSATSTTAALAINSNGLATFANGLNVTGGNVGIGTTTPWRKLSVTDTVSAAQFALAYDATRATQLQTDASGDLVIDPSGNDAFLNDDNFWVCTGGSCPSGNPSGTGNLIVENGIGIGTSTPASKLVIETQDSTTNFLQIASTTMQGIFVVNADGRVGIGTTTPAGKLGVAGNLFVTNGLTTNATGTATSTFMGDIKILGKLDVGTIDPVYTIDGVKYATYGHSTIGIKEEATAKFALTDYDAKRKLYKHIISFDELEKNSDLWLFYQVTEFGVDWQNLIVTLTPAFNGRTFYEEDVVRNTLTIWSDTAGAVSARFIANRYDAARWPNLRSDQDDTSYRGHVIQGKP